MDLVLVVQVLEPEQQLAADDGDVGFCEGTGFELSIGIGRAVSAPRKEAGEMNERTRSRHEPPARYSITNLLSCQLSFLFPSPPPLIARCDLPIHNFQPLKKLP